MGLQTSLGMVKISRRDEDKSEAGIQDNEGGRFFRRGQEVQGKARFWAKQAASYKAMSVLGNRHDEVLDRGFWVGVFSGSTGLVYEGDSGL